MVKVPVLVCSTTPYPTIRRELRNKVGVAAAGAVGERERGKRAVQAIYD